MQKAVDEAKLNKDVTVDNCYDVKYSLLFISKGLLVELSVCVEQIHNETDP